MAWAISKENLDNRKGLDTQAVWDALPDIEQQANVILREWVALGDSATAAVEPPVCTKETRRSWTCQLLDRLVVIPCEGGIYFRTAPIPQLVLLQLGLQ